MGTIVHDDDIRGGDARIEGSRITVLDVKRRVVDEDDDPHVVAGEYDLSLGDLFRALAYYYDNREEMEQRERERASIRAEGERRTRELLEAVESGETVEPE